MKKTYLVTGGAGFIGSHLCDALLAQGHAVRILDDFSTGRQANVPPAAEVFTADVADLDAVCRALDGADGVFHLAAIASVARGLTAPLQTHRVNATGTVTVMEAVRRLQRNIPVVYASSAAIYGNASPAPTPETAPAAPLSTYGADKLSSELHARVATHIHQIPTVGLRFFNVYGSRQDPSSPYSGVIATFLDRILNNYEFLTIHGNGGQARDFIHVSDVVYTLLAAMANPPPNALAVNACTGIPYTIRSLATLIQNLAGNTTIETRYAPAREGDIRLSVGVAGMRHQLWTLPKALTLSDGLGAMIQSGGLAKYP